MIEIVNSETHAFKDLVDLQAVANFLAESPDPGNWTGWERIGALPAPTVSVIAPEPAMLEEEPVVDQAVEEDGHAEVMQEP